MVEGREVGWMTGEATYTCWLWWRRREVNQQTESPLTCGGTSNFIRIVNAISDSITPFVHTKTFPRSACELVVRALDIVPVCQGANGL